MITLYSCSASRSIVRNSQLIAGLTEYCGPPESSRNRQSRRCECQLCGLTDRNADSLLLARKPTISHSNWINHPAPCIGATRRFGSLQINEVKDQTTQRLRVFEHLLRALLAVNLSQPLLTSPNLQRRTRDRTNLADTRRPVGGSINQAHNTAVQAAQRPHPPDLSIVDGNISPTCSTRRIQSLLWNCLHPLQATERSGALHGVVFWTIRGSGRRWCAEEADDPADTAVRR